MAIKEKVEKLKENAKRKAWEIKHDAGIFYYTHKEEIRALAPVVLGGLTVAGKAAWKNHTKNKEINDLACRHYDRRLDQYFWSKRPLKPAEALQLATMYEAGINKGEALRSMGLLRY